MLTRKENPALFSLVEKTLKDKYSTKVTSEYILDKDLQKIYTLDNCDMAKINLTSLEGIQKIPNLLSLRIYGMNERKLKMTAKKEAEQIIKASGEDASSQFAEEVRDKTSAKARKIFNENQIADLRIIEKCENLGALSIVEQRKVENINISNNEDLFSFILSSCPNIKSVQGLDKLNFNYKSNSIQFIDCPNLRTIHNFDKFVQNVLNADSDIKVLLPANYFSIMANTHKGVLEDEKFLNSKRFSWTEGTCIVNKSTMQMKIFKEKVDNILKTIIDKDDSDIVKISKVYRWICNNFKYSKEEYARQLELEKKIDKTSQEMQEQSVITCTLRSATDVFENKKGVCLGFARLLNFMLIDLGFDAREVFCNITARNMPREFLTSDHAISEVRINGKSYFMDPTFDLGKDKSKYFMLNKKEIEYTYHLLGMWEDESTENTPSIQKDLLNAGVLHDKTIEKQDPIERSVYQEMLGIEMESFL